MVDMRLMWTPPALWNYPADGLEHYKLEHVSKLRIKTKGFEILEI